MKHHTGTAGRQLRPARSGARADVHVFLGDDDKEVSPEVCARMLAGVKGGWVQVIRYQGAIHDFDDPGPARQAIAGKRAAREDACRRSAEVLNAALR